MPTLESAPNITEGDKRLSTIHHIVDLKQYTEAMSNSLLEINEISNQLPACDISERIEKHISLLVSVHQKVVKSCPYSKRLELQMCSQCILH